MRVIAHQAVRLAMLGKAVKQVPGHREEEMLIHISGKDNLASVATRGEMVVRVKAFHP